MARVARNSADTLTSGGFLQSNSHRRAAPPGLGSVLAVAAPGPSPHPDPAVPDRPARRPPTPCPPRGPHPSASPPPPPLRVRAGSLSSTPPPLPVLATSVPPAPPPLVAPAISAFAAPPAAAAPAHFEELRALVRGADDALVALNRTVREIERLVGQLERPSALPSVASATASSAFPAAE